MRRALAAFGLGALLVPPAIAAGLAPYLLLLVIEGVLTGDSSVIGGLWSVARTVAGLLVVPTMPVVAVLVPGLHLAGLPRWASMLLAALAGAAATLAYMRLTIAFDPSAVTAVLAMLAFASILPMVAFAGAAGALMFDLVWDEVQLIAG
jgi:hypothetical protein